jgi:hypothetical protein
VGHNTLKNQKWRKDIRRAAALSRQEAYNLLPFKEKLAKAGAKERAKLLARKQEPQEQ